MPSIEERVNILEDRMQEMRNWRAAQKFKPRMKNRLRAIKFWFGFWPKQIFPRIICQVSPCDWNHLKGPYEILIFKMWMGRPRWEMRYEISRPLPPLDAGRRGGITPSHNVCIPLTEPHNLPPFVWYGK